MSGSVTGWFIAGVGFAVVFAGHFWLIRHERGVGRRRKALLLEESHKLAVDDALFQRSLAEMERSMGRQFFIYDLIRKINAILKRRELFTTVEDELRHSDFIEDARITGVIGGENWLEFSLHEEEENRLFVKIKANDALRYVNLVVEVLNLCLERIHLYEQLARLSIHDALTGIYNRRYFEMRYDTEFTRARKYGFGLAVLMIDLDHFKKINDTYGHLVGDAVLKETAAVIKENIREIDFTARMGGEEFAVVLSETDRPGALLAAERIRTKIMQRKIRAFDEVVEVTVSVGAAVFPHNAVNADMLLVVADKFLYEAKARGRNCVVTV